MAGDTNPNRAPRLARPEGMSDQEWTLLRISKVPGMATAIIESDLTEVENGTDALVDFLTVSKQAEGDALKRYLALKAGIGAKLDAARQEYEQHASRSQSLYSRIVGTIAPSGGSNGIAHSGDV